MTTPTMSERIQEALELVRRYVGTAHDAAARAYLAAQVEIAQRSTADSGAMRAWSER